MIKKSSFLTAIIKYTLKQPLLGSHILQINKGILIVQSSIFFISNLVISLYDLCLFCRTQKLKISTLQEPLDGDTENNMFGSCAKPAIFI